MNKTLKKGFMVSVLSLSLVIGSASISLAMEGMGDHSSAASSANMPGMKNSDSISTVLYEANFGTDSNISGTENIASASTVPSEPHEATPGMDPNMSGMDTGASASTAPNAPHEATPGMDSDMPGMESNGHGENGESEGVNWTVVGSFLAINLLVIGTAGVLKFTKKPNLRY